MKKIKTIWLIILFAMLTGVWIYSNTGFYGDSTTQNAGFYLTIGDHWCGLETRGTFGFFCDVS
jgi:hypothetical protein